MITLILQGVILSKAAPDIPWFVSSYLSIYSYLIVKFWSIVRIVKDFVKRLQFTTGENTIVLVKVYCVQSCEYRMKKKIYTFKMPTYAHSHYLVEKTYKIINSMEAQYYFT